MQNGTQDTRDLEVYYDAMADLFASEGWKYFIKDIHAGATQLNSVEHTKDLEDLFHRKGQLAVMANVLNLETQLVVLREQAEQETE